jgi:hypothetical protein
MRPDPVVVDLLWSAAAVARKRRVSSKAPIDGFSCLL